MVMVPRKDPLNQKQEWPATCVAFSLIEPSYSWSLQRIDAANSRIQALASVAATITLGFPVVALALLDRPDLAAPLFWMGLLAFAMLFSVGLLAKMNRKVALVDLQHIYDEWLSDPPDKFKRDLLYFAAEHVGENTDLVHRKHLAELWIGGLLLVEISLWVLWTVQQF